MTEPPGRRASQAHHSQSACRTSQPTPGSRSTPGKSPSKPLAKLPAHQPQPTLGVALFRAFLAPFEIPAQITFVDRLPLTAKGSVDRAKLAQNGARNAVPTA